MNRILSVFIIPLFLFSGNCLLAQDATFEEEQTYSRFVKEQMKLDQIPGLTVGFHYENKLWTNGFGFIDLENQVEASSHSAYRLASNTKSMTAVAILKLYEENKLNLDDPVRDYVPYFPRKRWNITIRQLLGHLGGISHYKNYEKEGHIKVPKDTRESIDIFDDFDLMAKPGTEYHYTSYGYNLLGAVIEGAAETPYAEYLRENIWKPFNMDQTYLDEAKEIIPNRAQGYRLIFGELYNSEYVDITSRFASGGTLSTVPDLLKYARGINDASILSENSIEMMETSMSTNAGRLTDYGMGWRIEPVNGHFMAYHTGGQPETRTILMRFPAMKLNIACAYNLEGGNLHAFPRRLYQQLTGEAWNVKPYGSNEYDKVLIKGLWDIFNYGLAYYERHGKSMAGTKGELINMFHFLNKTLNPDSLQQDFETVKSKINMGRHPKAHHSYVRIGSYMAEVLVEQYGTERLDGYHKNGAFPFFADYIKLTKGSKDSSFLINEAMKKKILDYNTDWKESWNNATRELWFAPFEDIDRQLEMLASHAKNKKIYPDFTTQIFTAIWKGALISSPDKYIPAAKKFTALYPESAKPQLLLGNLYVLQKKFEEAQQAFELAMRAQVDRHVMAPSRLNYYATDLFQRNYLDEALIYVKVASTFYPGEGIWDDTRGDIYMEKSRRAFRQALDNDPTLEDSWKQLKKIE